MLDKLIIANASSSLVGASRLLRCDGGEQRAKRWCVRDRARERILKSWRREQVAPAFESNEKIPGRNKRLGGPRLPHRGKFNWPFVLFER